MRLYLYVAAATGVLGVSMGAFGAHALKDLLAERNMVSTWETAVLYNLVHACALLTASLLTSDKNPGDRWLCKASACWAAGILLFSGSLYWLALGAPRWVGPVTPVGGFLLIIGWLCLLGVARSKTVDRSAT